jgi:hypothetical protein
MPEVITFDAALKRVGAESCSILLGNGFSADYCGYKTLLEKSGLPADAPCRILFDSLDTSNFERVVRVLEDAATVEAAFRAHRRDASSRDKRADRGNLGANGRVWKRLGG